MVVAMAWGDARLEELRFLAEIERVGYADFQEAQDSPKKQMVASLLLDGLLFDGLEYLKSKRLSPAQQDDALVLIEAKRTEMLISLVTGREQRFWITHKGRVRLSELRQQLRSGRDRDETGLLWAKRHVLTDLAIEVLSACPEAPLSVAFLDMNGLKQINDVYGHAAGDGAIRSFFQTVAATLGQRGEAYRNGGDEVVVLLPGMPDKDAANLLERFVGQLGNDVQHLGDARVETRLTASCGSVSTVNAKEDASAFLERADKVQYRAKSASKKYDPRVSTIAVGDGDVKTYT
jgi:diguanylate cyclase (GGDEF)-like protein